MIIQKNTIALNALFLQSQLRGMLKNAQYAGIQTKRKKMIATPLCETCQKEKIDCICPSGFEITPERKASLICFSQSIREQQETHLRHMSKEYRGIA